MKRRNFFALTLAAATAMPLVAAGAEAADEAAIRALWKSYAAFRVSGDAEAWLALWDKNGIQMPPGVPARGIETLRPLLAEAFAARSYDARCDGNLSGGNRGDRRLGLHPRNLHHGHGRKALRR